jgi:hypothetical protein
MTPQPGQGTPEPASLRGAEDVVQLAKEDLAGKLGVSASEISVVSIEEVDWPDASLGCPQPGMAYAQVITPGFRVVLEAKGCSHKYHTDEDSCVVLCLRGGSDVTPLMPVAPHGIPGKPTPRGD